jgi:hypothetical protein
MSGRMGSDPTGDDLRMLSRPDIDVAFVRGRAFDPSSGERDMRASPLRDDLRPAFEIVGIEPGFDVRSDRLAAPCAACVACDRGIAFPAADRRRTARASEA